MDDQISELESKFLLQLRRFKHIKPVDSMMPDGITSSEGIALMMVDFCEKQGKQVRPGIISAHLHTTKSNTSQILRSLGEKGLVIREQSEEDLRSVKLSLTEEGKGMIAKMDEMRELQFRAVIEDFGTDNLQELVSLLDQFATCMETHQKAHK